MAKKEKVKTKKEKISSVTPEQMARMREMMQETIDQQTRPIERQNVVPTVEAMWKRMGQKKPPKIHPICPSPYEANRRWKKVNGRISTSDFYHGFWWGSWKCYYLFTQEIGVVYDQDNLKMFCDWVDHVPYIVGDMDQVFVAQNPVEIHWDDRELHNPHGMAVKYKDGEGIYAIEGVKVDEQIVMRPETQTIKQIDEEPNVTVKRIRIERYGWSKFLLAKNAKPIDHWTNIVEGGIEETLMSCEDKKVLVAPCPSQKKIFFMEVGEECNTLAEAKLFQLGGNNWNCLGRA